MTAWLVVNSIGLGLASCQGRWRWLSVSQAIRFARREDAEQVLAVVRAGLFDSARAEVRVEEHAWPETKAVTAGHAPRWPVCCCCGTRHRTAGLLTNPRRESAGDRYRRTHRHPLHYRCSVCDEAIPDEDARVVCLSCVARSRPRCVLPMTLNDGTRFEATSISGGLDEVLGMPRTVSIKRTRPDGSTVWARYVINTDSIDGAVDPSTPPEPPSGLEARR